MESIINLRRKKGMTIREKCKARMKHQRLENLRKSWSKRRREEEEKNRGKVRKAWESMERFRNRTR